jgi:hypothetical protein
MIFPRNLLAHSMQFNFQTTLWQSVIAVTKAFQNNILRVLTKNNILKQL